MIFSRTPCNQSDKSLGGFKREKSCNAWSRFQARDRRYEGSAINQNCAFINQTWTEVVAYDPVAIDNAKKILGDTIRFCQLSPRSGTLDADAVFIVTEWNEFRYLDLKH